MANRLFPFDKKPGVRPIGAGEVYRRLIGKTIGRVLKNEIRAAAGPLQVCAGQEGGSEAAVHALREIFELEETEGVLLIDAENGFNLLNRRTALWNVQFRAPRLARYLINTYRRPVRLFTTGGEISSEEGTTQGGPLGIRWDTV